MVYRPFLFLYSVYNKLKGYCMTRFQRCMTLKGVAFMCLVLGPGTFSNGLKLMTLGDPVITGIGVVCVLIGAGLCWLPYMTYKDLYDSLILERETEQTRNRLRGSTGQYRRGSEFTLADDDIDGDGIGGDSLTRMGITSRDN
jgi:hypothetical protein